MLKKSSRSKPRKVRSNVAVAVAAAPQTASGQKKQAESLQSYEEWESQRMQEGVSMHQPEHAKRITNVQNSFPEL